MVKTKFTESGFTLLEVVIATGMISLVMGAALAIMIPLQNFYTSTTVEETGRITAEIALEKIADELKEVSMSNGQLEPLDPSDSNSIKYKKVTDITTDPPTVGNFVEWKFEYTENNDGIDNNNNGVIDEGKLVRTEYDSAGAPIRKSIIARDIMERDPDRSLNGISFTRTGSKMEISISIEKYDPKGKDGKTTSVNYHTTVKLLD